MNKNEGSNLENTSVNEFVSNEQNAVNSGKKGPNKVVIIIVVIAVIIATLFAALIFIGRNRDVDGDGLTSADEKNVGTDAASADTDGDTLSDYYEVKELKTNPKSKDTDGDGVTDDYEVNNIGTDPLVADTDEDGLMDGEAVEYGTDPLVADSDEDGLLDGKEIELATDTSLADTDFDGVSDGEEVNQYGTNPLEIDTDGDYYNDGSEVADGMDPLKVDEYVEGFNGVYSEEHYDNLAAEEDVSGVQDSDGDNLNDDEEILVWGTDPNKADTDSDGVNDGVKIGEGNSAKKGTEKTVSLPDGTYTVTTTADVCEIQWGYNLEYEYVVRSDEPIQITIDEGDDFIYVWYELPDGETVTFTPVLD